MTDDADDVEYGFWAGKVWTPPSVEESYPKPVVLSAKEEQDRMWRLVEQAARG